MSELIIIGLEDIENESQKLKGFNEPPYLQIYYNITTHKVWTLEQMHYNDYRVYRNKAVINCGNLCHPTPAGQISEIIERRIAGISPLADLATNASAFIGNLQLNDSQHIVCDHAILHPDGEHIGALIYDTSVQQYSLYHNGFVDFPKIDGDIANGIFAKRGGPRLGSGRKKFLPEGTKNRCIKMTDEEYVKVKEFLAKLRTPLPV